MIRRMVGGMLALALGACSDNGGSAAPPQGSGSGPSAQVTLTVQVSGPGAVLASAPSIDCRATCQAMVPMGTGVHLTVAPDAGSQLSAWSGACSGSAGCDVTVTNDMQVSALFVKVSPPPPQVSVAVLLAGAGKGRVISNPAGIDCPGTCSTSVTSGTALTLTAMPETGSTFAAWSNACGGSVSCQITADADIAITARFDKAQVDPPPDDCAGLMPAAPGDPTASHSISLDRPKDFAFCQPGFVEGDGTLALDLWDGRPGFGRNIDFVSPSGATLGRVVDGGQLAFTEQLDGFLALNSAGDADWWVSRFDSNGQEKAKTDTFNSGRGMAVDPTGGAVVPKIGDPITGAAVSLELSAYDAQLALRWHATLPAERLAELAVDRAGNTLVLVDGDDHYGPNTVAGIWVSHAGVAGPEFQLHEALPSGQPAHDVTFIMAERVGSGLFVGAEGQWLVAIDALSTSPSSPPDWLAARPLSPMHMVHGGGGYAVLPNPTSGDCAQTIEVVSPSGKTCGSRTFRAAAGTCQTSTIRVGYDGTVVQGLPSSFSCTGTSCSCAWQWWSGYFG